MPGGPSTGGVTDWGRWGTGWVPVLGRRGAHWLFEGWYQLWYYSTPPPHPHSVFGNGKPLVLPASNLQPPPFMDLQGQALSINSHQWIYSFIIFDFSKLQFLSTFWVHLNTHTSFLILKCQYQRVWQLSHRINNDMIAPLSSYLGNQQGDRTEPPRTCTPWTLTPRTYTPRSLTPWTLTPRTLTP